MNQDSQVRAAAVCNEPGCEERYPDTDEVIVALWYGSDGLRDPISRKPKSDGDFMLCRNCGTQYEVKALWPVKLLSVWTNVITISMGAKDRAPPHGIFEEYLVVIAVLPDTMSGFGPFPFDGVFPALGEVDDGQSGG